MADKKLTLGFSPCPNDTFIFDALVNHKTDSSGFQFEVILEDVESLNMRALRGELDLTKLSFPALFQAADTYALLQAGGAAGKGVGPLLVRNKELHHFDLYRQHIYIPGLHTTANLLLSFAFPEVIHKTPVHFSAIEDLVAADPAGMGVLIHENRFTYRQKGLVQVADLGEIWEKKTGLPIPLGGIAVKRSLPRKISLAIEKLIRTSIEFAAAKYPVVPEYVQQHAQSMNDDVLRKHIELYVNNYSLELGAEGKKAIEELYAVYIKQSPGSYTRNRSSFSLFLD